MLGTPVYALGLSVCVLGELVWTLGQPVYVLGEPVYALGQFIYVLGLSVYALGHSVRALGRLIFALRLSLDVLTVRILVPGLQIDPSGISIAVFRLPANAHQCTISRLQPSRRRSEGLFPELLDRMQAHHIAFGVLDEGDEAILADGIFLLHHFASMLCGASGFHRAIGAREVNDRAGATGVLALHFHQGESGQATPDFSCASAR
jgi:hypothetical protein